MSENGWEVHFQKGEPADVNAGRRRSSRRLAAVHENSVEYLVRSQDNLTVYPGSLILVSEVRRGEICELPALVHGFRYDPDRKQTSIATYSFFSATTLPKGKAIADLPASCPRQVFASSDEVYITTSQISAEALITSSAIKDNTKSNLFLCNQAVEIVRGQTRRISGQFDWNELRSQINSVDHYPAMLRQQFNKPTTVKLEPDNEHKIEEPLPSIEPKKTEIPSEPKEKLTPKKRKHEPAPVPDLRMQVSDEYVAAEPLDSASIVPDLPTTPKKQIPQRDPRTDSPSKKKRRLLFATPSKKKEQREGLSLPGRSPMKPLKREDDEDDRGYSMGPLMPQSPQKAAVAQLHLSRVPDQLPCRDQEFSALFLALENAISTGTGSCIYVSGTPGTGKTATIREVIDQLKLRVEDQELSPFNFVDINGMKLVTPQAAYEILWEKIRPNATSHVSSGSAMLKLEEEFKGKSQQRPMTIVLMDELDQLMTRNQGVMYNFFNWPSLPYSRLVVIAVANTMDLPERTLSNKISSRLGLTRIQFPGYTYEQLREIISARLSEMPEDIIDKEAVEFAARKVAGVSGDARRALDICQRAFELASIQAWQADKDCGSVTQLEAQPTNKGKVTIALIKSAIAESTTSPVAQFLQSLALSGKILLCAILARIRRSGVIENSLANVLQETETLVKLSSRDELLTRILFPPNKQMRMAGFLHSLNELVEAGILIQQAIAGERSANIRLSIGEDIVKTALRDDPDVEGMI